jgi:hypothetical protein
MKISAAAAANHRSSEILTLAAFKTSACNSTSDEPTTGFFFSS